MEDRLTNKQQPPLPTPHSLLPFFLTICLNPTLQKTLCFPAIVSGTVNRTGVHRLDVSGKGVNVTRVLTQLGKKAVHLTQLGGDLRPLFLSLCGQDGLSVEWVESGSQIRFCYTLITETDGVTTELVEESEPVGKGCGCTCEKDLLEKLNSKLIIMYLKAKNPNLSIHASLT